MVSRHVLQVSRPTPRGDVEGDLAGGVSRPTPKGEVEGDLVLGGNLVPGGSAPRGGGGCVETHPGTATAACGTYPTGMHSCFWYCEPTCIG